MQAEALIDGEEDGGTAQKAVPSEPLFPSTGSLNPLLTAAVPLLTLIARIRAAGGVDGAGFSKRVVGEVLGFEEKAAALGVPAELTRPVRFALCATLDDVVSNTPWTGGAPWSMVLGTVLTEGADPNRFFDDLEKLRARPGTSADALEIMYLCLALGFEGRFRRESGGRGELNKVRDQLFRTIRAARGVRGDALAPFPDPTDPRTRRRPIGAVVPMRSIAVAGLIVLTAIFGVLRFVEDSVAAPVKVRLADAYPATAVVVGHPEPPPAPPPKPSAITGLTAALHDAIAAHDVDVAASGERVIVRVTAPGLFAATGATVIERHLPLLDRIADALAATEGPITVIGHTDATPVRTPRYPNNALLSLARATAVERRLMTRLDASRRIVVEGRGDSEPLAPNTTPAGRERNRRIEIVVGTAPRG